MIFNIRTKSEINAKIRMKRVKKKYYVPWHHRNDTANQYLRRSMKAGYKISCDTSAVLQNQDKSYKRSLDIIYSTKPNTKKGSNIIKIGW